MAAAPGGKKDNTFNIVVLGAGAVGKSCISFRLVNNQFLSKYDPTIEDAYRKEMEVDGQVCTVEILDSAGQDEYRGMRDFYYKNGDAFLLVYSVTDRSSLADVRERFDSMLVARDCRKDEDMPPVTVAGNKCDVEAKDRVVSQSDGQALAQELGGNTKWIETSAKEDINVTETFEDLVRRIKAKSSQKKKNKKKKIKNKCVLM